MLCIPRISTQDLLKYTHAVNRIRSTNFITAMTTIFRLMSFQFSQDLVLHSMISAAWAGTLNLQFWKFLGILRPSMVAGTSSTAPLTRGGWRSQKNVIKTFYSISASDSRNVELCLTRPSMFHLASRKFLIPRFRKRQSPQPQWANICTAEIGIGIQELPRQKVSQVAGVVPCMA